MVLNLDDTIRFYCYGAGVDMRKGIHSLYVLIKTESDLSALAGDAFVFIGTTRKSINILRWHKEWFILYHKKLELGTYILPQKSGANPFFELKSRELNHIIDSVRIKTSSNELKRMVMLTL